MEWLVRLRLSGIVVLLGLVIGGLGALLGARTPFWAIGLLVFGASMLFLPVPRLPHAYSQEDLIKELNDMQHALTELRRIEEKLGQLQQEVEEAGILKQEHIKDIDLRFQHLRQMTAETTTILRELLFGEQRRTLSVIVVMLLLTAVAAAGFVPTLGRWLF